MKFIDEAIITVQSGNGGGGCVSFRREKFIPRGGPDGGDGGKGGDIVFIASSQKRTLYQFRYKKQLKAQNGAGGQGKQRTGKSGKDLVIHVPVGTQISDADTGGLLFDFVDPDQSFTVAHGGRGGLGNARFKSATNRTPRFAQPGEPGQSRRLKLELKLLADVGIIGLPNAGKSTLVRALSSANPKIGNYPFTTLTPSLGVVDGFDREPFVVADIPGLIAGAHKGHGLGIQFLKHIERTRILVHLIDASAVAPDDPLEAYRTINSELALYNPALTEKPQIVVLNKLDISGTDRLAALFPQVVDGRTIISISATTGKGIKLLKTRLIQLLDDTQ